MSVKLENIIYLILLIPAFILGGLLHVVLYGVDFCDCICQIYYASLAIIWGIAIDKRVTHKQIKNLLFGIIALAILMQTLQICKYKLLGDNPAALRYAWYGYYISILFAPAFLFRMSLLIGNETSKKIAEKLTVGVYAGSALLTMLVLTNDLHRFVFRFNSGIEAGESDYSHGIGYYLICVWVALLIISSLIIIVKKCRVSDSKMMAWLPAVPVAIGCVCETLTMLGVLKYNGISFWQMGEIYFMCIFGFVEAGFVVGLIPANVGYDRLLDLTNKPIVISDSEGNVVYKSVHYSELLEKSENYLMFTDTIKGGTVSWGVDMSEVYRLISQIEEATEQIESRNEYLHTQNDMKAERSKLDARNEIYDNMAKLVGSQIDRINTLLNKDKDTFDENLREIAVLNAYIKRRSNMELLRGKEDVLDLKELYIAISESCEYIKLCGAKAFAAPVSEEKLSGSVVILIYEFFEKIVEKSLKSIKSLLVSFLEDENGFGIRFLVNSDVLWSEEDLLTKDISNLEAGVTVFSEESDTVILLSFSKEVWNDCIR